MEWIPTIVLAGVVIVLAVFVYCCCCSENEDNTGAYSYKRIKNNVNDFPDPVSVTVQYEHVDSEFIRRHVVLKEKIRNMSDRDKEYFAYERARATYNIRIPRIFSIIVVDDITNFYLAIAREVQRTDVGFKDVNFLSSQIFYVIHLERDGNDDYVIKHEGQARLWLSCRPENVVNHLGSVQFV